MLSLRTICTFMYPMNDYYFCVLQIPKLLNIMRYTKKALEGLSLRCIRHSFWFLLFHHWVRSIIIGSIQRFGIRFQCENLLYSAFNLPYLSKKNWYLISNFSVRCHYNRTHSVIFVSIISTTKPPLTLTKI